MSSGDPQGSPAARDPEVQAMSDNEDTATPSSMATPPLKHDLGHAASAHEYQRMAISMLPAIALVQEKQERIVRGIAPSIISYAEQQQKIVESLGPALLILAESQKQMLASMYPALATYAEQQEQLVANLSGVLTTVGDYANQRVAITNSVAPAIAAYADQVDRLALTLSPTLSAFAAQRVNLVTNLAPSMMILATATEQVIVRERLRNLRRGFTQSANGPVDAFGRLHDATVAVPQLESTLTAAINATQARGSFGPNYTPLRHGAEAINQILESGDRGLALDKVLSEVRELTHLDDELLLDFGEALGWWEHVKSHRISTAGLLLGFTAGLTFFVAGYGGGAALPGTVVESLVTGGAVYFAVSERRPNPKALAGLDEHTALTSK